MFSGVSTITNTVDSAFLLFLVICVALLGLITFLMVFFVIKYHHKRHSTPENIEGNALLEVVWTIVPVILVLGMFYFGWVGYRKMRDVPPDAMVVQVIGSMWQWNFEYANGKRTDVLRVPVDQPVKLELSSLDVIHSFYVPAFRIKEDVVPGLDNFAWFEAQQTGTYDVLCAEYCGLQHAYMLSKVIVMPKAEFEAWYASAPEGEEGAPAEAPPSEEVSPESAQPPAVEPTQGYVAPPGPAKKGAQLVHARGCVLCHTVQGKAPVKVANAREMPVVGPSLQGIFGRKVRVLRGEEEIELVVDEAYLKRSILQPGAEVVKGFRPVMPPQDGFLTEQELEAIVRYLKTL